MSNNHLTDYTIQSYILKEISEEIVELHISECPDCKAKLETYQLIMSTLENLPSERFSFDVTRLAMEKITESERKKESINNSILMSILGILILGVFALSLPYVKPIFRELQSITAISTLLILVSALSILIFFLADQFRQYKQKENLLFK
jgi:hypothetical protein